MKSLAAKLLIILTAIVWDTSMGLAVTRTVSSSSELQSALNASVAGDEVVVRDGVYTGQFIINASSGTTSSRITLRAENKHGAIFSHLNTCSGVTPGLYVLRNNWVIKDLRFRNQQRAILVENTTNVEIHNNIITDYHADGIALYGSSQINIHHNAIAYGDACNPSYEDAGIALYNNADNNTIRDNIIFATGNNGYQFGSKNGYGMIIANNSDDNIVQGNILFANGGKGVFRVLAGTVSGVTGANRNVAIDNAFLFGEGGPATDDCYDDSNSFINNLLYGNYHSAFFTKGNPGGKGHHQVLHNLFYITPFSRAGGAFASGGCGGIKEANILKDNLFYSADLMGGSHLLFVIDGSESFQVAQAGNNLFWAPSSNSWVSNYTYKSSDVRSQPIFTDAANGDFSLASGSPGKGKASDGKNIGIEYNAYLKKSWLQSVFSLPTQQKDNLATSASFSVNPNKYYQVWFYIPASDCNCVENFNVEGQSLSRDINGLTSGSTWIQPGGPARWITLGRHRATDGTLNISWSNSASAEKIFIRELPTVEEAYGWISGTSGGAVLTPPTGLVVSTTP